MKAKKAAELCQFLETLPAAQRKFWTLLQDGFLPLLRSLSSRDGYFEMGLDDSGEELVGSAPFPEGEEPGVRLEEPSEEQLEVRVRRVLWCCCVLVGQEVKQRGACLVLTDRLLALLLWSHDSLSANQERGKHPALSGEKKILLFKIMI